MMMLLSHFKRLVSVAPQEWQKSTPFWPLFTRYKANPNALLQNLHRREN